MPVRLLLARVTWGHVHQAVQVIVLTLQILTSGIMFNFLEEEASEIKKECSLLVSSKGSVGKVRHRGGMR